MVGVVAYFIHSGFDIKESIGETPKLVLNFYIDVNDIQNGNYVFIPRLICDIELISSDSLASSSYSEIGHFGTYEMLEPIEIKKTRSPSVQCEIPLTSPKLEKMLEIRQQKRLVGFYVNLKGYFFVCDTTGQTSPIKGIVFVSDHVKKQTPYGGTSDVIVLSTEEFTDIIKKVKHYELLTFDVPYFKTGKVPDVHIEKALKLLKSASSKLNKGDSIGALKDVRDAVLNHLFVQKKTDDEVRNVLRQKIVDAVLKAVPQQAKDEYEKLLKGVEKTLNSLLQNMISKFIHIDSDKIERAPLHEDVEFAYAIVLHTTRYLAKYMVRQ